MAEVREERRKRPRASRNNYTVWLTWFVICILFLVDPDSGLIQNLPFGAGAVATLVVSLRPIIIITLIHMTRKWIFDYVDLSRIYHSVMESENYVAQALFALSMAVFTLGFAVVFAVGSNN